MLCWYYVLTRPVIFPNYDVYRPNMRLLTAGVGSMQLLLEVILNKEMFDGERLAFKLSHPARKLKHRSRETIRPSLLACG